MYVHVSLHSRPVFACTAAVGSAKFVSYFSSVPELHVLQFVGNTLGQHFHD